MAARTGIASASQTTGVILLLIKGVADSALFRVQVGVLPDLLANPLDQRSF